jgi:hypothetical protein
MAMGNHLIIKANCRDHYKGRGIHDYRIIEGSLVCGKCPPIHVQESSNLALTSNCKKPSQQTVDIISFQEQNGKWPWE